MSINDSSITSLAPTNATKSVYDKIKSATTGFMGPKSRTKKTIKLILIIIILIAIVLLIGTLCYRHFFNMNYTNSIYNTMLTASTLGVDPHTRSTGEKVFTGLYGLFCAIFFVTAIGVIVGSIFGMYYEYLLE